jgi:hypothetical protein
MLLKGEVNILGPRIKAWNFLPALTGVGNLSLGVKSSVSARPQSSV